MVFGLLTTQRANKRVAGAVQLSKAIICVAGLTVSMGAAAQLFGKKAAPAAPPAPPNAPAPTCDKPLYLTLDTGHMDVAQMMADVLTKHQVKATFFVANEKTKDGKESMSFEWGQKF